jgi:hypothetical protein
MKPVGIEGSPFVIAGPARPEEVVGRDDILATLGDRARRGRFVLLTAPRRYGKTTLIHRLRHDADRAGDIDVVIVDLLGVQTLDDIAVRLAQSWTRLPHGPLARAAAAVLPYIGGLDVAGGVVSLRFRAPQTAPSLSTLEAVLDVPRAVAQRTKRRILVVLDEFQAIASVDRADAVIRSQIQHHTDQVSYLFSGSEQSTLHMLFNDRARPLYGQAERLPLGPFDLGELGDYLQRHLTATGRDITPAALTSYLAFVEGHPQRSMLVADCMWDIVTSGQVVDRPHLDLAVSEALARGAAEFAAVSDLLSEAQTRLLRLLAYDEPLTGAAAGRLGLSQGSARSAAATLTDRGLLHPSDRGPRITDPLLAEWTRRLVSAP